MTQIEKLLQGILDTHPIGKKFVVSVIHDGINYESEICSRGRAGVYSRFQAATPGGLTRKLNAFILEVERNQ